MSVFNIISDWGNRFTADSSFLSNFFWSMNRPLVEVFGLSDEITRFISEEFRNLSCVEFAVGFGLSWFFISHVIKLVRSAYFV